MKAAVAITLVGIHGLTEWQDAIGISESSGRPLHDNEDMPASTEKVKMRKSCRHGFDFGPLAGAASGTCTPLEARRRDPDFVIPYAGEEVLIYNACYKHLKLLSALPQKEGAAQ